VRALDAIGTRSRWRQLLWTVAAAVAAASADADPRGSSLAVGFAVRFGVPVAGAHVGAPECRFHVARESADMVRERELVALRLAPDSRARLELGERIAWDLRDRRLSISRR
jgi:hypothetical protein